MRYYIDENGERHYSLPSIWKNFAPVAWSHLEKLGWTMVEEPDPEPEPRKREYSKFAIMEELERLGLYERVNQAIDDNGMRQWWNDTVYPEEGNEKFEAFLLVAGDLLPEGVSVQSILDKCEVTR